MFIPYTYFDVVGRVTTVLEIGIVLGNILTLCNWNGENKHGLE